jgi:hypothetical protein
LSTNISTIISAKSKSFHAVHFAAKFRTYFSTISSTLHLSFYATNDATLFAT